ncbi:hypothetical protein S245_039831 [Arachis hypogaea]|nr:Auxin-responsive protein [Arachis hypogaea]
MWGPHISFLNLFNVPLSLSLPFILSSSHTYDLTNSHFSSFIPTQAILPKKKNTFFPLTPSYSHPLFYIHTPSSSPSSILLLNPLSFYFCKILMQGVTIIPTGGSGGGSTMSSTLSKEDTNLVLSSEDSSCPEDSELLELGLGLGLSHHHKPAPKSHSHHHHHARILTAKDFPSSASASSSSSSSPPSSSLSRVNNTTTTSTSGTKRTAESVAAANNGPSPVVGWPPLRRPYRVNSFNHSKSPATEVFNSNSEKSKSSETDVLRKNADNTNGNNNNIDTKEKRNFRSSLFVKVNMDGIAIGRKVDLSVHSSYETLAQTLEDMFRESTTAITFNGSNGEDFGILVGGDQHSKLLDGSSKFVLTYEDKDGDWMLVGDVPWGMFLSSVRRLRIMRTSEANGNGLAPMLEEKNCRQKSKPI